MAALSLWGLLGALGPSEAWGLSESEALARGEVSVRALESGVLEAANARSTPEKDAEQRLAIGEMLERNDDHEAAIAVLEQVVELHAQGKASAATHADALFLLGECYFEHEQLLSAGRQFRAIAERARSKAYQKHAGRALSRLVDIAVRRGVAEELDFVFTTLAELAAPGDSGGAALLKGASLRYAKGKALFAAGRYDEAIDVLSQLPDESKLGFQAQYLLGVVYTNQAALDNPPRPAARVLEQVPEGSRRFAQAILQFQRVTLLTPKTEAQRHVVDLAWMALGRLFYETHSPLDAADAYQRVGRDSPEFATMLFELAWVFVSMEDYERASQTLEVLEVVAPDSLGLAEGALLRADLLLRDKKFEQALQAYESVIRRFRPAHDQLDRFLAEARDPAEYFDRLVRQRLGIRARGDLPAVVMDWLRDLEDERVFALVDDVARSRQLITESRRMARAMTGVLSAQTKARAFPELRVRIQRMIGLSNGAALAYAELTRGLDAVRSGDASAEYQRINERRRSLATVLAKLPIEVRDFVSREAALGRDWDALSQRVQALSLQTDKMRAIVNGLHRLSDEQERFNLSLGPEERARLQSELRASEAELDAHQAELAELRESLERGRMQVGFGGPDYRRDQGMRDEFIALSQREFALALAGHGGEDAREYAVLAQPVLARLTIVRDRIDKLNVDYERQVEEKATQLLRRVRVEHQQVDEVEAGLELLDRDTREVFGELARKSFGEVQQKLASILLRADVGIAAQAWEVRQAHFDKVRDLQRIRSRGEQELKSEFEEVVFDGRGRNVRPR